MTSLSLRIGAWILGVFLDWPVSIMAFWIECWRRDFSDWRTEAVHADMDRCEPPSGI